MFKKFVEALLADPLEREPLPEIKRWSGRLDGKYDVHLYHGGFGDDAIWPLRVFEIDTGDLIGEHGFGIMYHPNVEVYRRAAEQIVSDHLRWSDIPK